MTLPRSERLKVLGLWPLWQLKNTHETDISEVSVSLPYEAPEAVAKPVVSATKVLPPPFEPDPRPIAEPAPQPPLPVSNANRSDRPFMAALQSSYRTNETGKANAQTPETLIDQSQSKATAEAVTHPDVSNLDWQALRQAIETCTRCDLHATRTHPVFGVGDIQADWLFVGEAPGAEEDRRGEPFVGQAGQLLDAMLAAIGLNRQQNLYIANVLKSRPPGNHDPRPEEVAACLPFLERQIALIRPQIIVALGRFAAQTLLRTDASISKLRGNVHQYEGIPMVVTYHPAYLLRNPADKAKVWEDLCLARRTLQGQDPESNLKTSS